MTEEDTVRRITIAVQPGQDPSIEHEGFAPWELYHLMLEVMAYAEMVYEKSHNDKVLVQEVWECQTDDAHLHAHRHVEDDLGGD